MDTLLEKYAASDLPRYTSYPPATQFAPDIAPNEIDGWIAAIAPGSDLSVYVHVPFCQQLCWYCGCHTSVPNGYERAKAYVDVMLDEIDQLARRLVGKSQTIAHLHFGGGTPTYLKPSDLGRIIDALAGKIGFANDAELAIEMDPRLFSRQMADELVALGLNRASFGVQDFDPVVQAKINRIQPFDMVARAVDDLRAAGISAINFDLIYGLPGQTTQSVIKTARDASALGPSRLAVFGYAHVPWFKKHMKMILNDDLPDTAERFEQARAYAQTLTDHGFIQIGLDHFVQPGDAMAKAARNGTLRRNFQGYTTDAAAALLGLGVSSISATQDGYWQNPTNTLTWTNQIRSGQGQPHRGVRLTPMDRLRADIIERLMCDFAVDPTAIARAHGYDPAVLADATPKLNELEADGLITRQSDLITIPPETRVFVRHTAAAFDTYLDQTANRHSKAV